MPKPQPLPPRTIAPAGNHVGRVYSIIHIGVIDGEWKGKANSIDKIRIGFELPLELHEFKEGETPKPFVVSEEYSFMMGKKSKLRPIIEGIIGVMLTDQEAYSFEINDLMGRVCMVNIVHTLTKSGTLFPKIASTASLPKGMESPDPFNKPFFLDYEENWNEEAFNNLPEFIREKMQSSHNYQRKFSEQGSEPFKRDVELTSVADMDFSTDEINFEDIPF